MRIGNNILVKVFKVDKAVRYDVVDGGLVLFNFDRFRPSRYEQTEDIFTGIMLSYPIAAELDVRDLSGNELNFRYFFGELYVEVRKDAEGPVCAVRFVKDAQPEKEFYGRFIEVNDKIYL